MVASSRLFPHGIKHKGKDNPQGTPSPSPPPTPPRPAGAPLVATKSILDQVKVSNYEAKRIRQGLGVLADPPSPSPLSPQKDSPVSLPARTQVAGPQDRLLYGY